MNRFGSKAFTLVEMLVVIAVIALLISLIVPALSGARRAGEQAKCLANLRSIGQISLLHATDNQFRTPALGRPYFKYPFWAIVVQQATEDGDTAGEVYREDSVLVCPGADRRFGPGMTRTYATNVTGHAGEPGDPDDFDEAEVFVRLDRVRQPSLLPWYLDSSPAPIDGAAPPPTRTLATIDFRNPEHVPARLGLHHGSRDAASRDGAGTRFNWVAFDGAAKTAEAPDEFWETPLP